MQSQSSNLMFPLNKLLYNENGITNKFIHEFLERACVDSFYGGVYASDQLRADHLTGSKRIGYVVNLNPSSKISGGHFVALIIEKDKILYIDPVGLPCLVRDLSRVLHSVGKEVLFNRTRIQDIKSNACALFACVFLMYFSKKERKFEMKFDKKKLVKNDKLAVKYIKKLVDLSTYDEKQIERNFNI